MAEQGRTNALIEDSAPGPNSFRTEDLNSNLSEWFKVTQKKPSLPANAAAAPRSNDQIKPQAAVSKTGKGGSTKATFRANEFIVYPAHGVGQITAIEEQEVAGFKLELYVISFAKDKMTLKVPTPKVTSVGMRKLAEADVVKKALDTLTGRAARQAHHVVAPRAGI